MEGGIYNMDWGKASKKPGGGLKLDVSVFIQ